MMGMRIGTAAVGAVTMWLGMGLTVWLTEFVLPTAVGAAEVRLEPRDDRVDVTIDGGPFTSYIFSGHPKPILFPIVGPTGVGLTRQWPMVDGVAGEPHDHPHHESLWFTHGDVNGHDFWGTHPLAGSPTLREGPRIEHVEILQCESGPTGVLETANRWVTADGTVVCTDTRRVEFTADGEARMIDYTVTIHAGDEPVTFGDTKEGTMGLRVRPELQPRDVNESVGAAGRILNSEGQENDEAWGKAARWVDYSGTVGNGVTGVAMLDHPENLRHPCHWHARDYGLMSANPFGLHDFANAAKGTGDHVIPAGGAFRFRSLFVFHAGDAAAAGIEQRWQAWAAATRATAAAR